MARAEVDALVAQWAAWLVRKPLSVMRGPWQWPNGRSKSPVESRELLADPTAALKRLRAARARGHRGDGWEGHLKFRAARGRLADLQGAFMEIDRLLDDGEAEARTLARGRTLFERLQKIGDKVVAEPRPVVFDNDGAGGPGGDGDVSARRRVANGVLQQVAQGLAYGNCVADDGGGLLHGERNLVVCVGTPIL